MIINVKVKKLFVFCNTMNMTKIGNQQDFNFNLTNNQIQVLLSGMLGDGHIQTKNNISSTYSTNSIFEEYIDFKLNLLGNLKGKKRTYINKGYKENLITYCSSRSSKEITKLNKLPIENKLKLLDNLGLALWFYDDGSLHKNYLFFNLNTQNFDKELQQSVFIPYFNTLGMKPKLLADKKKNGKEFYYLYFGKHFGAFEIMKILSKYPLKCFEYKLWSSETIQKWSKLQTELKNKGIEVTPRKFTNILNGISSI